MTGARPVLESLGEDAVLLRLGDRIDADVNARVHALAARLRARSIPFLTEIVPAFTTLALRFAPEALDSGRSALEVARSVLDSLTTGGPDLDVAEPRLHRIPVRYGGEAGPDLESVAGCAGLCVDEIVRRHIAVEYRVGMLGFAAGFPYLLGMDPALTTPRHATPRIDVAAGSVGIGGAQTGIYPRRGPGGWQIIGRTDLRLFDVERESPALLAPGDRVRFVAATAEPRR